MIPRLAALALVLLPAAASACSTAGTGASCVTVPPRPAAAGLVGASAVTPAVAVGEVLERGEHSILLNADYYGLPPVSDGWVYMRVRHDLFRVDWSSHQVLERVTEDAAANF